MFTEHLQADKQLPDEFVLEIDLQRLQLVEQLSQDPLAILQGAARQVCVCGGLARSWVCFRVASLHSR